MKNKVIIIIVVMIIILFSIIIYLDISKTDAYIIKKGYKLFGEEYCTFYLSTENIFLFNDPEHPIMAGTAITWYKCKLCNKKYEHPNTAIPKICSNCRTITNRCRSCGKLQVDNN